MTGRWPVIIGGTERGSVTAERCGAYTLISAEARAEAGLVRLSLYGAGRELYLGVLAPDGGGLARLRRRFTRSELASFAAEPEYAAPAGLERSPAPGDAAPVEEAPAGDAGAGDGAGGDGAEGCAGDGSEDGELWYSAPDGTLSRFDGRRLLVALPAENVRVPAWARGVVRRINGREYVVFPR